MDQVRCVLDARARLGECPRWDERAGVLYWVDIDAFELHRFDPATGRDDRRSFDEEIGCFSLRARGGFVAALRSGFVLLDDFDAAPRPVADPQADLPGNRFNDGRCDPAGRFLAGTMNPARDADTGALYALGADLGVHRVTGGTLTSNGLAFSPDGATMFHADTPRRTIHAFDYDIETGRVANKRIFHRFPVGGGRPDGAAVDAQGCYWTALYDGGRIARLSPEGEVLSEIPIPARHCTMVAFGGADLKTLYVTTARNGHSARDLERFAQAGGLFAVPVDVPGLIEPRFAG